MATLTPEWEIIGVDVYGQPIARKKETEPDIAAFTEVVSITVGDFEKCLEALQDEKYGQSILEKLHATKFNWNAFLAAGTIPQKLAEKILALSYKFENSHLITCLENTNLVQLIAPKIDKRSLLADERVKLFMYFAQHDMSQWFQTFDPKCSEMNANLEVVLTAAMNNSLAVLSAIVQIYQIAESGYNSKSGEAMNIVPAMFVYACTTKEISLEILKKFKKIFVHAGDVDSVRAISAYKSTFIIAIGVVNCFNAINHVDARVKTAAVDKLMTMYETF